MDPYLIIGRYYKKDAEAERNLVIHSESVARKALELASRHLEMNLDLNFLKEAALLHDIGIYLCHAPSIGCYGTEPYIRHGILGAEIMRREGFERHARVCEKHTGTGLTAKEIELQHLPLPLKDYLPETLEEKLVCYADKFFSKSDIHKEKTWEEARRSILSFDKDGVRRFDEMSRLFE